MAPLKSVQSFFCNLKTDIEDLSKNKFMEKNMRNDLIKSVACRILGVAIIAASAIPFAFSAVSLVSLSPVTAVGWAAIGTFVLALGHDIAKVGMNMREGGEINMMTEAEQMVHAMAVSSGQKEEVSLLSGTYMFAGIHSKYESAKKIVQSLQTASA